MSVIAISPDVVASNIWTHGCAHPSSTSTSTSTSTTTCTVPTSSSTTTTTETHNFSNINDGTRLLTKRAHADYCNIMSAFFNATQRHTHQNQNNENDMAYDTVRLYHKYDTLLRIAYRNHNDHLAQVCEVEQQQIENQQHRSAQCIKHNNNNNKNKQFSEQYKYEEENENEYCDCVTCCGERLLNDLSGSMAWIERQIHALSAFTFHLRTLIPIHNCHAESSSSAVTTPAPNSTNSTNSTNSSHTYTYSHHVELSTASEWNTSKHGPPPSVIL